MDLFGYLYAAIVAAGGLIGYFKAGSIPSLVAGVSFGALSALGAYQISQAPSNHFPMLCTSGVLTCLMGYRFYNSYKFMPAGLVCILSLLMFARSAMKVNTI